MKHIRSLLCEHPTEIFTPAVRVSTNGDFVRHKAAESQETDLQSNVIKRSYVSFQYGVIVIGVILMFHHKQHKYIFVPTIQPVSYTHLTLPTNREV